MSVNVFIQCSQFVIVAEYERLIKLAQASQEFTGIKDQIQADGGLAVFNRPFLLRQLVFTI